MGISVLFLFCLLTLFSFCDDCAELAVADLDSERVAGFDGGWGADDTAVTISHNGITPL
jgi:hypothetical protein